MVINNWIIIFNLSSVCNYDFSNKYRQPYQKPSSPQTNQPTYHRAEQQTSQPIFQSQPTFEPQPTYQTRPLYQPKVKTDSINPKVKVKTAENPNQPKIFIEDEDEYEQPKTQHVEFQMM